VAHGFDAPCLAQPCMPTRPMQGHGADAGRSPASTASSRQARRSGGGLSGLADQLSGPLATYTEKRRQKATPPSTPRRPIAVMLEKTRHRSDLPARRLTAVGPATSGTPTERHASSFPQARSTFLFQENTQARWLQCVAELSRAFAHAPASGRSREIPRRREFFQRLQACPLTSQTSFTSRSPEQIDAAIRQLCEFRPISTTAR